MKCCYRSVLRELVLCKKRKTEKFELEIAIEKNETSFRQFTVHLQLSDDFKPCKDFSLQTAFAGFKFVFEKMTQES